jgi:hypothetical protein
MVPTSGRVRMPHRCIVLVGFRFVVLNCMHSTRFGSCLWHDVLLTAFLLAMYAIYGSTRASSDPNPRNPAAPL